MALAGGLLLGGSFPAWGEGGGLRPVGGGNGLAMPAPDEVGWGREPALPAAGRHRASVRGSSQDRGAESAQAPSAGEDGQTSSSGADSASAAPSSSSDIPAPAAASAPGAGWLYGLIPGLLLGAGAAGAFLWERRSRRKVERDRDRLFSLSLGLLCVATLGGRIRRANPAFQRVLGYRLDELAGRSLVELAVAPDDSKVEDGLARLAQGKPWEFEGRFRCASGGEKWLLWNLNPAPQDGLLYAVAHDITDRKRAEAAVLEEYGFRKAIEESVSTGLRAIDLEGRIIDVNPAFCRMLGWSETELLGLKPPFPYWPPEERPTLEANFAQTLAGKIPPRGFEQRVMRKNGERIDVRFYISPLIDGDGRQTGWMGSMTDITEPKRVRAELERSQERFVTVLDGLDSAVYVADVDSNEILFANRAFKYLFGADAVGRDCWEVTGSCRPPRGAFDCDPRLLSPEVLPRPLFDGEVRNEETGAWYHLHDRAIRWVDGRVVRVQIATDISERKRLDEVNLQQQKRLEQTSRLITMGEMASSLAHELNQPLAAIAAYCAGCVKRLQSGRGKPEELLSAMAKASAQAERAGKIIHRMRDFVKKSEPHRAAVALADIVEETLGFANIEAHRLEVMICLDLPPELPPLWADRIMIEQVLLNLVKNGIEAMGEVPRERRQLTVSARLADNWTVEVTVADHGHGLGDKSADQLFAPFFTTKTEGMGMGLSICRSMIEFHQGRLWAEPNPDGGALFKFTLPLEREL